MKTALQLLFAVAVAHYLLPHYVPHLTASDLTIIFVGGLLTEPASIWSARRQYRRKLLDRRLDTHKGIGICDMRRSRVGQDDFVERTKQAIDFIQEHDLRRFRRIQRHCKYIVNREQVSGGAYDLHAKVCLVDFSGSDFENHPDWHLICYAALVVHEATHGLLFAKKIPYNKVLRLRIERFCREEERRFLKRVQPNGPLPVEPEPDEEWLQQYWNRKERAKMWKERMSRIPKPPPTGPALVWQRFKEQPAAYAAGCSPEKDKGTG